MCGTRLSGAGAILVGRDEPRDDCFKNVGLGGGERLERFTLRGRRGHGQCRAVLRRSAHCGQLRPRNDCDTCRPNLLEDPAPRDIA
jgi:hypothetical protein